MWTGGWGPAQCGRPHRKLKLESTDVILSSSHAKKLATVFTRISSLDGIKSGNFPRYRLVIKISNSTVLNKLQSYSRISALSPEGHCARHFKRAMCISCRPHVDVHKGRGGLAHVDACGKKIRFFVDVINRWPLCSYTAVRDQARV